MDFAREDRPLPAGYRLVPVRTTYLEMKERPAGAPLPLPPGCEVRKWREPGTEEYRRLFQAVGNEWGWSGRLLLAEDELKAVLAGETNEIHLLYSSCRIAGFAELDRGAAGAVEIAYFGLLPDFTGRGLGKFFLDWTVRKAWEEGAGRVWLHTCEFDHPRALATYLKAGFRIYGEKTETQPYLKEFLDRRSNPGG